MKGGDEDLAKDFRDRAFAEANILQKRRRTRLFLFPFILGCGVVKFKNRHPMKNQCWLVVSGFNILSLEHGLAKLSVILAMDFHEKPSRKIHFLSFPAWRPCGVHF